MNSDSVLNLLREYRSEAEKLRWEGTLEDYINLIKENPGLQMSSHERIYKMIMSQGVEKDEDENIISYNFFKNDLFGVNEPIEEIVSHLRASAYGSEVARRILLLYGPTSSGKSQLAILLKRGLEVFSKTEEGAIYRLSDSPMHEDPLTAIPQEMRPQLEEYLGVRIRGELSPYMRVILKEQHGNNFLSLPVERFIFSERDRAGIGTFVPSDKKSQDISELVGSIDLSKIGKYGVESDPRAYKFDGELMIANRGMMEFVEMLKVDQKFLYVLLTLAQEKNIKTARFPLIYADEFLLSHSNETEFRKFLAKDEMEALHDRTVVIQFPYNLKVDAEVQIYEKLIGQANFSEIDIAPHTLTCAAMFSVLSRLKDANNQKLSLLNKMRLYNGEEIEGFTQKEVRKFREEFREEGMEGVSPRYVINRVSNILAEGKRDFVTPIDMIRSLRDGLESNPKLDDKEKLRLTNILMTVVDEYAKMAKNDVQKAFFLNFEDEIQNLLTNYMEHVESYLDGSFLQDEWGNDCPPDERLMRSIEEKIQISDSGKRSFRQEIFRKMLKSARDNEGLYQHKDHPRLREALEKQLFDERQDVIRLTVSTRNPDEKELRRVNVVIDTLVEKQNYSVGSANELLRYVSSLMARN